MSVLELMELLNDETQTQFVNIKTNDVINMSIAENRQTYYRTVKAIDAEADTIIIYV